MQKDLGNAVIVIDKKWFHTQYMSTQLKAHFDGEKILLDEPFDLQQGMSLLITVLAAEEREQDVWTRLAKVSLARAYGDAEPEYSLDDLV